MSYALIFNGEEYKDPVVVVDTKKYLVPSFLGGVPSRSEKATRSFHVPIHVGETIAELLNDVVEGRSAYGWRFEDAKDGEKYESYDSFRVYMAQVMLGLFD